MKKFWQTYKPVLLLVVLWRIVLWGIEMIAPHIVPQHPGYIGPISWANHDGIHYLAIASSGYFQYGEAFFPLYPMVIRIFADMTGFSPWYVGSWVSYICFTVGLCLLYKILLKQDIHAAWRTIVFILVFPTSFFFTAVYTEGLFFLLCIASWYAARNRQWVWSGIYGALASATRLQGVLLLVLVLYEYMRVYKKSYSRSILWPVVLIPAGLLVYMAYLYTRTGDPLMFFHVQPAFGANRSGDGIILLPQVIWRYMKIIWTAFLQPTPVSYAISVLEYISVVFGYGLLIYGFCKKINPSYLIYGLLALTVPTLTGTFSSVPRYMVTIFPLFIILGTIRTKTFSSLYIAVCVILQIVLSALFVEGWFVS